MRDRTDTAIDRWRRAANHRDYKPEESRRTRPVDGQVGQKSPCRVCFNRTDAHSCSGSRQPTRFLSVLVARWVAPLVPLRRTLAAIVPPRRRDPIWRYRDVSDSRTSHQTDPGQTLTDGSAQTPPRSFRGFCSLFPPSFYDLSNRAPAPNSRFDGSSSRTSNRAKLHGNVRIINFSFLWKYRESR